MASMYDLDADAGRLDVDEDVVADRLADGELWEDSSFSANDMSLYTVHKHAHKRTAHTAHTYRELTFGLVSWQDLSSPPEYANVEPRLSGGPHPWYTLAAAAAADPPPSPGCVYKLTPPPVLVTFPGCGHTKSQRLQCCLTMDPKLAMWCR